jgi:hypothetical protein
VLARLSGLGEEWMKGSSQILRRWFPKYPSLDGRIANLRLLEIRAERDEWKAKCREGGRKSGKTRRERSKGSTKTLQSKREVKGNTPSPSPSPSSVSVTKTPKGPPTAVDLNDIIYPDGMDTPQVRRAIQDWLEHKQGRGERYKNPMKQMGLLLKGASFGGDPNTFVVAVEYSIGNNWAGIHQETQSGKGRSQAAVDDPGFVRSGKDW